MRDDLPLNESLRNTKGIFIIETKKHQEERHSMTEREFVEKIAVRREQGLCKISDASAWRYAKELRKGSELNAQLQADGILEVGKCLLDLTEADMETLKQVNRYQALHNLKDRPQAAIKQLLQLYDEKPLTKAEATRLVKAEAEAAARAAAAKSVSAEDGLEYVIVSATTLRRPSLKEYPVSDKNSEPVISLYGLLFALYQAVRNKQAKAEKKTPVYTLLMRALLQENDYEWKTDLTETDLRIWGHRYAENAARIQANLTDAENRGYVMEDLEYALTELSCEDDAEEVPLRLVVASACEYLEKGMEGWFMNHLRLAAAYPRSQVRMLLHQLASMKKGAGKQIYSEISNKELMEKLADLFLLALEAAEGNYPAVPDLTEKIAHLEQSAQDMLAVVGSGFPVQQAQLKKMEPEAKKIIWDLAEGGFLVPYGKCLLLPEGMEPLPLTGLAEKNGCLRDGAASRLFMKLVKETVAEDADTDSRQLLMNSMEELADRLVHDEERFAILKYLAEYYWNDIEWASAADAISLLEHLLKWVEKYPQITRNVLKDLIRRTRCNRELAMILDSENGLLEGVLQSWCARNCLEMAAKDSKEGYWTAAAVNRARKALLLLENTEEPYTLLQTRLVLALGLALQGNEEAGLTEDKWPYSAGTLVREYLLPCLEALQTAEDELNMSWLTGDGRTEAMELLEAKKEECFQLLTGENSPLCRHLKSQDTSFRAENWCSLQWVRSQGLALLAEKDLFQVMHRNDRLAKLFLPWYCNSFDSTLSCGPECTQELTEASLLNILLSGQKITMAANQMVDNEKIWNLTEIPAFLWCLQRGYVSVSLFGPLETLMDYAVTRMRNPNFYWSSLSEDFQQMELRNRAADFLERKLSVFEIPEQFRSILTKMRDAVLLMDENLRMCWRSYYHQQNEVYTKARGILPMVSLQQRVADYYKADRDLADYETMRRLNTILTRENPGLDRSLYRKMIWALRDEDLSKLEELHISPAELEAAGLAADHLAAEKGQMLEDMIWIIDDCQNRMLGERISTHQYYVYDEAASRIVPEWHTGPSNPGGRLLYCQIEKEIRKKGALLGWAQIPERISELQRLAEDYPKADAERLCNRLASRGLHEYGIFGLEGGLRLKNLDFRASTGAAVGREYTEREGNLYQMERNLGAEKRG